MTRGLTVEAPAEFIEVIRQMKVEGLTAGLAMPANSSVDVLDAPMNKQALKTALQVITLLLGTATAAVKLGDAVETFIKHNPDAVITVRDAIDGSTIGKFDKSFSRSSIDEHLKI